MVPLDYYYSTSSSTTKLFSNNIPFTESLIVYYCYSEEVASCIIYFMACHIYMDIYNQQKINITLFVQEI